MAHLLKPLELDKLTLKNRLVMPPMQTEKAEADGTINHSILDYYAEKSDGGCFGLIIVEHSYIAPEGKSNKYQVSIAEDRTVEGLKRLADTIHDNGSKAVMQITHAGSGTGEDITGTKPVGPSAVQNPRLGYTPRELTIKEIDEIVQGFQNAARRTKEAGFDGVEIHSAHAYFLNQFLSPLTNKRTDKYGGDIHNRIRLHLEIIEAVRDEVGEDFPVLLRLGAFDYQEGGTTIEDSQIAAQEFEKAGIDILDISGGLSGYDVPGLTGQGYFAPLTEAMKEVVSIPVILTGGITEPQAAEKLLAEEKADLIGVGRAILKDSNWAKRAISTLKGLCE